MLTVFYALRLENDKYYVGESDNLNFTLCEHMRGEKSPWTKTCHFLSVDKVFIKSGEETELNTVVRNYMIKYGVDNVRGGIYEGERLPVEVLEALKLEIPPPKICTRCGRNSHNTDDCFAQRTLSGERLPAVDLGPVKQAFLKTITCFRCGRKGHYAPDCTRTTTIDPDDYVGCTDQTLDSLC